MTGGDVVTPLGLLKLILYPTSGSCYCRFPFVSRSLPPLLNGPGVCISFVYVLYSRTYLKDEVQRANKCGSLGS